MRSAQRSRLGHDCKASAIDRWGGSCTYRWNMVIICQGTTQALGNGTTLQSGPLSWGARGIAQRASSLQLTPEERMSEADRRQRERQRGAALANLTFKKYTVNWRKGIFYFFFNPSMKHKEHMKGRSSPKSGLPIIGRNELSQRRGWITQLVVQSGTSHRQHRGDGFQSWTAHFHARLICCLKRHLKEAGRDFPHQDSKVSNHPITGCGWLSKGGLPKTVRSSPWHLHTSCK